MHETTGAHPFRQQRPPASGRGGGGTIEVRLIPGGRLQPGPDYVKRWRGRMARGEDNERDQYDLGERAAISYHAIPHHAIPPTCL